MIYLCAYSGLLAVAGGCAYYSLNHQRINYAHSQKDYRSDKQDVVHRCFQNALKSFGLENSKIRLKIVPQIKLPFAKNFEGCVGGHHLFGETIILYNDSKKNRTESYITALFKYEIVHIIQNDMLKIPLYGTLAGLLPLILAITQLINPWIGIGISFFCTLSFTFCYLKYTHHRATKIALEHSKDKEIETRVLKSHFQVVI